jgi:hypothetical protein
MSETTRIIKLLMESTMQNSKEEQVRFTKDSKGHRRNTLFTVRRDGFIYWGVSRCKTPLDKFNRELGLRIAEGRARKALEELRDLEQSELVNKKYSEKPSFGKTKVEDVKALVEWFKKLNEDEHSQGTNQPKPRLQKLSMEH